GLLRTFFGGREEVDEEASAARRDRPARPSFARASEQPQDEASAPDTIAPAAIERQAPLAEASAPAEEMPSLAAAGIEDEGVFLYLNLGRRDGVRPGEILRLLAEECGLDKAEVGRIRIRDRHTFVGVPREKVDAIVQQLTGKSS